MKPNNLLYLTLNELKQYKLFFGMVILISSLLFSVAILMVSLATLLPKEIYKEVKNTELGYISIDNIETTDVSYLTQLPLVIASYGYDMDWDDFMEALPSKQLAVLSTDFSIDASIAFEMYRPKRNSETMRTLNKNLIKGTSWSIEDNAEKEMMPIWVEDTLAKQLQLDVNQKFTLKNQFSKVEVYIKGIYKDKNDDMMSSYLPISLYGKLISDGKQELHLYAKCDDNLNDFLKTITQLKDKYFIITAYDETIKTMMLMVYLLYVTSGILIYTAVQIVNNLHHLYYIRRKAFWNMCGYLGMTRRNSIQVRTLLFQFVLLIALFIGSFIAKILNQYFINFVKELFEIKNMPSNISITSIGILYILCQMVFIFITVLKRKQIR